MTPERFAALTDRYPRLRIAVVGDFCLDRYLEIDPAKQETSIETGLPVHNVVRVRAQPGGAGTILNNLAALGVGEIPLVGCCGDDGEGYELLRGLAALPGVRTDGLLRTPLRRTFTYCKPLLVEPGKPPVELSRLDSKNWTATPDDVQELLVRFVRDIAQRADAVILLEQVDRPDTGVITARLLRAVEEVTRTHPRLCVLADSRRGLSGWPAGISLKMNRQELRSLSGGDEGDVRPLAARLARQQGHPVFVTLSEEGIVGAAPDGTTDHVPALPLRGPIDIVGAGDCVSANLTAALAAGASVAEAIAVANTAASVVVHQLGTTGTASVEQIKALLNRS